MNSSSLDKDRLKTILEAEYSYYGSRFAQFRDDDRLTANAREFIAAQFRPDMRVLDIGCGNGATLLENSHRFESGLGVDHDLDHIGLARDALGQKGCTNVEFRLLDFPKDVRELEPESFDIAFTERGPIGNESHGIQSALRVLKNNGLLFCEMIGDLHHQEVAEVFGPSQTCQPRHQTLRTLDQARVAMERNGVCMRIAADVVSKRYYPSIYEWLRFQCRIWAWSGRPLPSPDDVRLARFAERNTTPSGEIETTHHTVWAGGVKRAGDPFNDERRNSE